MPVSTTRRLFLRASCLSLPSLALGWRALHASAPRARRAPPVGLGPLRPVADETTGLPLLKLPRGFRYRSLGWTGDVMTDGTLTPDRHDGMAVVPYKKGHGPALTLIRNHERGPSAPGLAPAVVGEGKAPVYDDFVLRDIVAGMGGGTTALFFDEAGKLTGSRATLGGTLVNCAGGPTPWGSWLTCEEIMLRGSKMGAKDHGYVFEVPAPHLGAARAVPIVSMGFMRHEAAAVDPKTGFVYLTEDNDPRSGLYRFRADARPRKPGDLERGGTLEMLKVVGARNVDLGAVEEGQRFEVEWVPIEDPDLDPESFGSPSEGLPPVHGQGRSGPFRQGEALGGAVFRRGEGCWYHEDIIYFVDTRGGRAQMGSVFALELPRDPGGAGRLTAVFVSAGEKIADNPDNVTITPRGGIILCEDGAGRVVDGVREFGARLLGIGQKKGKPQVFSVAENNVVLERPMKKRPRIQPADYRFSEFAGATFSPSGRTLFVNVQTPGITFAIRGPWEKAGL